MFSQKTNRSLFMLLFCLLSSCVGDWRHEIWISVPEQKLILTRDRKPIAEYKISTSKFGLGDQPGSYATPLGQLRIRKKIGDGLPIGAVLKSRQPTGEILPPNAPGRDPIVTRILWLEGLEPQNQNSFNRFIYIHGTPQEKLLGNPSSFGCIRMASRDIINLFDSIGVGTRVYILDKHISF
ncbi:MAG: L,D-transpeptidase [Chthoniobacterales bacterium]|nr:L,D-transpeptidase [Chthoniobacterales bacterium]